MRRQFASFLSLAMAFGSAGSAYGQLDLSPESTQGKALRAEGMERSQAYRMTTDLVDGIGGRLSASPSMRLAQSWAMDRLRALGAQNVRLESCGDFGMSWEQARATMTLVGGDAHPLSVLAVPWSVATSGVVRSEAIAVEASTAAELERYRGKLRGKIVLVGKTPESAFVLEPLTRRLSDEAVRDGTALEDVRKYYLKRQDRLVRMAVENRFARHLASFLESEGVSAILLPTPARAGGTATGLLQADDQGAPGGRNWRVEERPRFPMLRTTAEDFGRLKRVLTDGKPVTLEYEVATREGSEREKIYNVIADIPATASTGNGEYILVGAHLDSWAGAAGAVDNGAGVGISLEAARLLIETKMPLKRPVRIVLYEAEEQGLYCSGAYADQHLGVSPRSSTPDQLEVTTVQWRNVVGPVRKGKDYEKLSAAFNVDSGSGRLRAVFTGGSNPGLAASFKTWLPALTDLGINQVFDEPDWPADHVSFTTIGIPGINFLQDPLDYNSRAHHSHMDTVERLDPKDMAQASVVLAAFLAQTANAKDRMPRPSKLYP